MRTTFCPECLDDQSFSRIEELETFTIRDESIEIKAEYLQCAKCGEKITDPSNVDRNLDLAYREYRMRKGLLQPEEIVQIRKSLELSIIELEEKLKWPSLTLERYETGALQTREHNKQLLNLKR
ncbi:type II TA system antitoxin MqsA family protein [Bacillus pumilus]|uniref:type II TA system antitoxin MqsA family protein n=1 Tax=Bacillus pumilus TaxID=1408 RepID=UPI0011A3A6DD|nr:type II TA system antitoxin MqsA family protein [Bacillus pumilus]